MNKKDAEERAKKVEEIAKERPPMSPEQEAKSKAKVKAFLESIPEYNQAVEALSNPTTKHIAKTSYCEKLFGRDLTENEKKILHITFDVICFILGPCVFSYGFFNGFSFNIENEYDLIALRYHKIFYPNETEIVLMTIGVALICLGFLSRHWRRNTKINSH